jgi:hypothetical protein
VLRSAVEKLWVSIGCGSKPRLELGEVVVDRKTYLADVERPRSISRTARRTVSAGFSPVAASSWSCSIGKYRS